MHAVGCWRARVKAESQRQQGSHKRSPTAYAGPARTYCYWAGKVEKWWEKGSVYSAVGYGEGSQRTLAAPRQEALGWG